MIRFLVLFCLLSGTAHAHNKSISFSDWLWNGRDVEVIFTVSARDITFLPQTARSTDLVSALGNHLQDRFELRQINTPCTLSEPVLSSTHLSIELVSIEMELATSSTPPF